MFESRKHIHIFQYMPHSCVIFCTVQNINVIPAQTVLILLGVVCGVLGTPQFGVYWGLTSITCQVLGRLYLSCSTFKEIMLL